MHRNQKRTFILIAMAVLGSLLNAAPELLELYGGIELPLYFLGTILLTILCGSFPGMLASAGSVLLQYVIYTIAYGARMAYMLAPAEQILNGVLIALILGQFIRRGAYRKAWTVIPATLLCGLGVTLLGNLVPVVDYAAVTLSKAGALEDIRMELQRLLDPEEFLGALWLPIVNIVASMGVSLAVFHLLSRKWREKLRTVSRMMKPIPAAEARKSREGGGKGYGHSLKSRITMLVIVSVCLSAMIVALVANNHMTGIVEEEYDQITGISAESAAALIMPEMAAEIERKGAEAEGYEQLRARLQKFLDRNGKLSRLCAVRVTDEGMKVLFDVAPQQEPTQAAGEILEKESTAAKLFSPKFAKLTEPLTVSAQIGQNNVYSTIYPVLPEADFDETDMEDEDALPEPLFHIIACVQTPAVSEYTVLFVLRIIAEFLGIFIILISFGFWITRNSLIDPITAMSFRADQISGSLNDEVNLNRNIAEMNDLDIHTADETETLYKAVCQMAQSVSERMKRMQSLFDGTVIALVNAIDAKDQYTHGHSTRVAVYARQIAELAGKNDKECEEIYLSALLHDIGKIGVPGEIINKKGRLTDEEFAVIKRHPTIGYQILKDIAEYPYLSVAAHYHHERYDGKGYPEGIKGDEIPEIGRIIAVADAYDAMTSNRSYRSAIPQHIVREELIKGSGTQFDPRFAQLMIQMIDHDADYSLRETDAGVTDVEQSRNAVHHSCTDGYIITEEITRMRMSSRPDAGVSEQEGLPILIAFDSLDGKVHPGEENNRDVLYYEYARIRLDGQVTERSIRKSEVRIIDGAPNIEQPSPETSDLYRIEAIRRRDHALIRIASADAVREVILALPDNTRFLYLAICSDRCEVHNIFVKKDEAVSREEIPRIAEEISYIRGCPEGDVPNVEVDAWRTAATDGIPITDGMKISFHAMSLPTARMVWHCPFISVFSSGDGKINGPDFREYILLRMDGETWESDAHAENNVNVEQSVAFAGWNDWKEQLKAGIDCTVTVGRDGRRVTMRTENLGVAVHSETTILDEAPNVRLALTGDQCAITNIRIVRT